MATAEGEQNKVEREAVDESACKRGETWREYGLTEYGGGIESVIRLIDYLSPEELNRVLIYMIARIREKHSSR
jgi:hypothetical protein